MPFSSQPPDLVWHLSYDDRVSVTHCAILWRVVRLQIRLQTRYLHTCCVLSSKLASIGFGYDETRSLLGRLSAHIFGLGNVENPDYRDYTSSGSSNGGFGACLKTHFFGCLCFQACYSGLYAQSRIKLNVAKYSQVPTRDGITGAEVGSPVTGRERPSRCHH